MSKGREKIQKLLGTVGAFWPVRQTKQVQGKLVRWVHSLSLRRRILYGSAAGIILLAAIIPTVQYFMESYRYTLDDATLHLVGKANPNLASKLTYDHAGSQWQFNKDAIATPAGESTDPTANIPAALKAQIGGGGKSDQSLYAINFPTNPKKGVTMYDSGTGLSFTMTPQFKVSGAKATDDGRLVYPMTGGAQLVYTPKNNGMKEDIVLPKFIGKELTYSYKLDLPDTLTARVQSDGSVGIFSIDPSLLGTVSTNSDADAEKLKSAREHAEKSHLLFAIPAPVIVQTGDKPVKATARFGLADNILTVTARDMDTVQYPASVDPSVVITSSSDFGYGGNDEGNIDYSTSGQIGRGGVTGGTVGSWTTTTAMDKGYDSVGTVAYNGYLYRIGGTIRSPQSVYQTTYYAPINSNGTIGSWTATTGLPASYGSPQIATYNGYMYLIADVAYSGSSQVVATTYYSKIASDGTLGSWTSTTSLPQAITGHAVVAAGGHIYTLGGSPTSAGACGSNNDCMNTVYYAPLNGDGTIGSWSTTSSFTTARARTVATVYGDYIYIGGGGNTGYLNDVQYARINSDGTLGGWASTTAFTNARYGHQFIAYQGYMYMYSGRGASWYNDVRYAQINANGTLGSWATTTSLGTGNGYGGGAIYNGYLYIMGGYNGSVNFDDVQYTKIDPTGYPAGAASATAPGAGLTNIGSGHSYGAAVVANGCLYFMGGYNGSAYTTTVYQATISSGGTIGTWSVASNAMNTAVGNFGFAVYGNYMYVIGGIGSGGNSAVVQYASLNASGCGTSTWATTTAYVGSVGNHAAAAYNGYLYMIGSSGAGWSTAVYYAPINSDGTIGSWTVTSSLNTGRNLESLVAYGGYLYVVGGRNATNNGVITSVEYAQINSNGTVGSWTAASSLNTARENMGVVASGGYLYVFGGDDFSTGGLSSTEYVKINTDGSLAGSTWVNGGAMASTQNAMGIAQNGDTVVLVNGRTGLSGTGTRNVYRMTINNGGGINGNWTMSGSTFTTGRYNHGSVVYDGYLYILGGLDSGGNRLNDVQYAPLGAGGTVGSWSSTTSFPTGRNSMAVAAYGGYMYVCGGKATPTNFTNTCYSAPINSNGTLGSWTATTSLPDYYGSMATVLHDGRLYLLGGVKASANTTVRYAQLSDDGTIGAWTTTTSFTGARSSAGAVVNGDYMYILGGTDLTNYLRDVQYAPINSDGTLGSWNRTTDLPSARGYPTPTVLNGYLYLYGGFDGTTVYNAVNYAPLIPDGRLGAWMAGTGHTNARYGHQVVIDGGYAYLTGGYGNGNYYANAQSSPIQSIARVARYSKLIDLGSTNKVTGITYNGTLPGGTAQISYRYAGDNGVFGSLYSVGQPPSPEGPCIGTYGSGRYIWLSLTLDDSYTGTRANLTDVTVIYESIHPATEIRLRGGKTLQNGVKSALDTCHVYG